MGAGSWHPDAASLKNIRDHILAHPRERKALGGLEIQGDSLVRIPQGYDAGHPLADALRLKDFYTCVGLTNRQVCAGDFLETLAENCRRNAPLMKFLTKAVELPW